MLRFHCSILNLAPPFVKNRLSVRSKSRSQLFGRHPAATLLKQHFPASFTVETAMLMPLILLTVFSSLYLTFYIHASAALTANAAEQAVSTAEFTPIRYMASSEPSFTVEDHALEKTVSYSAQIFNANDNLFGELNGRLTYRKFNPAKELRWKQHLRES